MTVPNVARMYDYYLGGKDNFAADREAAGKVLSIAPEARLMARENRRFIGRAVRYLIGEAGIDQIIDVGTGLPTQSNVHEVAAAAAPETRVVYVDNDPVVITHANALLNPTGNVRIAHADVRRPDEILNHPDVLELIDLDRPVAILLTAIFHFITDEEDPYKIVARFREAMAPGSHLGLSHSTLESGEEAAAKIAKIYQGATAPAVLRTREEIRGLFDGFDLLEPGVVFTPEWRPEWGATIRRPERAWMLAGVGRKK